MEDFQKRRDAPVATQKSETAEVSEMCKEYIPKDDGRYIIFYSFDEEQADGSKDPDAHEEKTR